MVDSTQIQVSSPAQVKSDDLPIGTLVRITTKQTFTTTQEFIVCKSTLPDTKHYFNAIGEQKRSYGDEVQSLEQLPKDHETWQLKLMRKNGNC